MKYTIQANKWNIIQFDLWVIYSVECVFRDERKERSKRQIYHINKIILFFFIFSLIYDLQHSIKNISFRSKESVTYKRRTKTNQRNIYEKMWQWSEVKWTQNVINFKIYFIFSLFLVFSSFSHFSLIYVWWKG